METRLQRLSKAGESFNQNISTIFELASKSHELFKISNTLEKDELLVYYFKTYQLMVRS
jgi:hypothetical protein